MHLELFPRHVARETSQKVAVWLAGHAALETQMGLHIGNRRITNNALEFVMPVGCKPPDRLMPKPKQSHRSVLAGDCWTVRR